MGGPKLPIGDDWTDHAEPCPCCGEPVLDTDERTGLDTLYTADQVYFEVFDYANYMGYGDKASALDALEADVRAFIADLKSNGVLNP